MTYKPDIVIYHANCADGFGAAWAAWRKWGDAVKYVPCAYGQTPPDVAGKHVLIGDFSFKRDVLTSLSHEAKSIIVLDHHETAEAELQPWVLESTEPLDAGNAGVAVDMVHTVAVFDMHRSGAAMMWQFCHPDKTVPLMIQLIEDRDLWRFTLHGTKPFGVWLRCEPFDFARWTSIATALERAIRAEEIMSQALAMQRFFDQKVEEIARLARWGKIGEHQVPLCNCPPMFASEVGHWLLEENPDAPFVATYSDQGLSRGYSLRSRDGRMNVADIAKKFGGGGHRNAAGFGVPLP